jgi:hypothetical protein
MKITMTIEGCTCSIEDDMETSSDALDMMIGLMLAQGWGLELIHNAISLYYHGNIWVPDEYDFERSCQLSENIVKSEN